MEAEKQTSGVTLTGISAKDLKAELKKREDKYKGDRKAYKDLVSENLPQIINNLVELSNHISIVKLDTFKGLKALLDVKCDVYDTQDCQQSHTFSDDKGNTITYGFRVTDDWDDTVGAGISKTLKFLESLAKDEASAKLVQGINRLLKKDAKGSLKASRVLELAKWAKDLGDEYFIDAVQIICDAYKPLKSAFFIDAYTTGSQNKKESVSLNISSADFPEGTDTKSLFPVHEDYLK